MPKSLVSVLLLAACAAPCLADPPDAPTTGASSLAPNAVVERILQEAADQETVELSGYVGSASPDVVRLYRSLSLSEYLEVPRAAVVSTLPEGDAKAGPVRLLVRAGAMVVSARRHPARDMPLARRGTGLRQARPAGDALQDDNTCALSCLACGLTSSLGACVGCASCALI